MGKQTKEKTLGDRWGALLHTIWDLRLPWLRIAISLALNLTEATLLLKLPVTTSSLMSGNITGAALMEAILYYVLTGIISVVSVAAMAWAQSSSVRSTRDAVWKKMLGMRMDFFDRNDPSEQMSAITNDANAGHDLVNIILNLLPAIYYVVGAMWTISEYHWVMALSCFALLPLKYLYAFVMGRVFQKSSARLYQRIGVLTGFLADRIAHLPLIKTYTNEDEEERKGQDACQELLKADMRIVHQENVAIAATSVMDIVQKFAVVVVAVVLLQRGEIDLATWLTFFLFSQNLFSYMDQVFDYWTRIKGLQGTFRRVVEIMQSEDEPTGGSEEMPDGDICFDHVTFTYPGNDAPALQDVTFTVPRGSSAAIVGLCGSGKTTAISLLERLYQPDAGRVMIGSADVQELSLSAYRQRMAYVQQGAGLFSGKIRDLLTYGIERPVSDEEMLATAEKTGFDEYLSLCADGLETEAAPGGGSMSGGQAQRLVLTREVLRGGDIILLDEPTSALDMRVSAKIQQTIDTVFADKTRILVTHDLDLAKGYDKIIVLSGGKVMGEGTHQQLLESCETYRTMIENVKEEAKQCAN